MKNLKIDKRKLLSLLLSSGICLTSMGMAEISSYNCDGYLDDGQKAKIYFTKKINDASCAYISTSDMTGFVFEKEVKIDNNIPNNYFMEDNSTINVQAEVAYIYQTPEVDNTKIIRTLHQNDMVDLIAKTVDGWYVVYINGISGFMREESFIVNNDMIKVAKLTKNNINVRSSATTKEDNIIGFADVTDCFKILDKEDDWYVVDYLGQKGYIKEDFIRESDIDESDNHIIRMAYLTSDSSFWTELDHNPIILPAYQNVGIISDSGNYYKVMVDGVVGYVLKNDVKNLSKTCVIIDLSRQILKVYKGAQEVFRAHIISGRKSLQTPMGCFKIGHKIKGYQLTTDSYVYYWIQYDGNRGIHDASWQKDSYFIEVAKIAYDNFTSGYGRTYPSKYGSHGCDNMKLKDIIVVYGLVNVGDNVLVIGPNNLIRKHIISKNKELLRNGNIKIKKLV